MDVHFRKMNKYFSKHVFYNSVIHALGGVGIGVLLASPLMFPHPIRWGVLFLGLSILGHVYIYTTKK
jgi:hypothetical protein